MAWPANANNISTTNLSAGTSNPASARADLKAALDEITNLINGRNEASGVAGLDASSKIAKQFFSVLPLMKAKGAISISPVSIFLSILSAPNNS